MVGVDEPSITLVLEPSGTLRAVTSDTVTMVKVPCGGLSIYLSRDLGDGHNIKIQIEVSSIQIVESGR